MKNRFQRQQFDYVSFFCTGLTGAATFVILAILAVIVCNVVYHGWGSFSWRFLTGGTERDMFSVENAGILPMIVGTAIRVILMTIFVVPIGVITAIYLTDTRIRPRFLRGLSKARSTIWRAFPPSFSACSDWAFSSVSSARTWTPP